MGAPPACAPFPFYSCWLRHPETRLSVTGNQQPEPGAGPVHGERVLNSELGVNLAESESGAARERQENSTT
jgi:hypothetical protein